MDTYSYTVKCLNYYYGYPEAKTLYEISTPHFTFRLTHYGNHGIDIPILINNSYCNGYFWRLQPLMKFIYKEKNNFMDIIGSKLKKPGLSVTFKLDNLGQFIE